MAATSKAVTGKRKRPAVSYAEKNDDLDALIGAEETSDHEDAVEGKYYPIFNSLSMERAKSIPDKKHKRAKWPHSLKKTKQTPTTKKAKAKETHFRFLDLPRELRDMIYEFALTDSNGVSIVTKTKGYRTFPGRGVVYRESAYRRTRFYSATRPRFPEARQVSPIQTHFVPALLAVNRQINGEAADYLYGQYFAFDDTTAMFQFLSSIGLSNQQRLANIEVMRWGLDSQTWKANNYSAMAMLAGATNLKSLTFDCRISGGSTQSGWLARAFFRDAHRFLEAYGSAKGRKDAALNIIHIAAINFYVAPGEELEDHVERLKSRLRALLGLSQTKKRARQ